jgi:ribosome-associated translation inhibitor RaiA
MDMNRKNMVLMLAVSVLSLGIGVIIGYGVQENKLAATAVNMETLESMDIESALMMVQMNQAKLLEGQLKEQIDAITAINETIAKLNSLLNKFRTKYDEAGKDEKKHAKVDDELIQLCKESDFSNSFKTGESLKKEQWEEYVNQVKRKIEEISDLQQTEMLSLQSLSTKRNETFELMTEFIRKSQDARSKIIGNLR